MRKGYVDTDFGQVHYYADGDKGPRLFLFHETALSGNEFEKALPLLGRRCRAVAIDTPGYGMSDPPPAPLTMPQLAERIVAAIDSFGDEPCALAGGHTGASIALDLAANSLSGRATHVVLSGLALLTEEQIKAMREVGSLLIPETIHRDGSHLKTGWQTRVERWGDAKNDDLDMLHWGMVEGLRVHGRAAWALEAVFTHDTEAELKKLSCPTYFLVGEYDSLVEFDKTASGLVPGSKLTVLLGMGGRLPYVEPELYANEVLGFLGVAG